jgi:hypothetical protein
MADTLYSTASFTFPPLYPQLTTFSLEPIHPDKHKIISKLPPFKSQNVHPSTGADKLDQVDYDDEHGELGGHNLPPTPRIQIIQCFLYFEMRVRLLVHAFL